MGDWRDYLKPDGDSLMRIKKRRGMLVDAVIVSDSEHVGKSNDRSLEQLTNAASLPGVVGEAWGMADFHQGYGFPRRSGGNRHRKWRSDLTWWCWFRHQLWSSSMLY